VAVLEQGLLSGALTLPISDTTFYAVYDGASVGSPSTTSGTVGEAFSSSVPTSGFASERPGFHYCLRKFARRSFTKFVHGSHNGDTYGQRETNLSLLQPHTQQEVLLRAPVLLSLVAKGAQSITWSPSTDLTLG
jgi:hypothetical protein